MSVIVAPSILSADFSRIAEEVALAEQSKAEFLHLDVMDGLFVPNQTFGPDFLTSFPRAKMVYDVHLMVKDVFGCIDSFAKVGADYLTFHLEAVSSIEEAKKAIDVIHSLGKKAGISIKPNTEASAIKPLLKEVDLVLVMSVEPGKGGQKFMPNALAKIAYFSKEKKENNYSYLIEVDGGINAETGAMCVHEGAEVLVAGSYLFGHEDFLNRVEGLWKLI